MRQFSYPRVAECALRGDTQAPVSRHEPDYEMRCPACAERLFSSRAPDLVKAGFLCPSCQTTVLLVRTPPQQTIAVEQ